jgi:amino acid transporter
MGGTIGMIPPLMIFGSYINLRLRKDHEERTFKMGSRRTGLIIGIFIQILFIIIFLLSMISTITYKHLNLGQNIGISIALNVGAVVIFVLPMSFAYWKYDKKNNLILIAKEQKISIDNKIIENRYDSKL